MITKLKPNQVFVFGSNAEGFHGAGGAGQACRGERENTWRKDTWFREAMRSPAGSDRRIGKWAVYGVSRGFQEGREGKSYAIQTIAKPGLLRSVSRICIFDQLFSLWLFAEAHPQYQFLFTPIGVGYAGFKVEEMNELYSCLTSRYQEVKNIELPDHYRG